MVEAPGADRFLEKTATLDQLTAGVLASARERAATPSPSVLLAHKRPSWRAQARTTFDRVGARVYEAESPDELVEAGARISRPWRSSSGG